MKATTRNKKNILTAEEALNQLVEGNKRFLAKKSVDRDLIEQVSATSTGQYPMAAVLGCIDSRVPSELIFDQGIGDIFNVRVAGNIVNEDILGSLEYACHVAGANLLIVLGHTKCGAVTSACKGVELGNITALLNKIKPSVERILIPETPLQDEVIEKVTVENVKYTIQQIRKQSVILNKMEQEGEIAVVGAIYDVYSGAVELI